MKNDDYHAIANYCKAKLDLKHAQLSEEYYYQSLPLCVIDAVYSINANYTSTRNTVIRFANYFNIPRISRKRLPEEEQLSISKFLHITKEFTFDHLAQRIYQNRQLTSSRGGILKAEAVNRFTRVLLHHNVEYLQDVQKVIGCPAFEEDIKKIPGQRSGISTRYFYMLAGSDDYIKPDRMIARFIWDAIHQTLSVEESHAAIVGAFRILEKEFPNMTPRILDYQIWQYQRAQKQ